ncbi:hypothetical protein ACFLUX_02700 [Chloroflexota bacterium]
MSKEDIKKRITAFEICDLEHWFTCLELYAEYGSYAMVDNNLGALCLIRIGESSNFKEGCNDAKNTIASEVKKQKNKRLSEYDRNYILEMRAILNDEKNNILKDMVVFKTECYLPINELVKGTKSFIDDKLEKKLNPLEKDGLDEAISCLLANAFTSAEFISLRAAESVLKRWYEKESGSVIKGQTWGQVLKELVKLYPKESERPKELALLDYLNNRRNAIAHPDATSDARKSATTFLNVIKLCNSLEDKLTVIAS